MTFVVIKADLPNAMSECNFLSDFIDEKSMAGELGYTLASFQVKITIAFFFLSRQTCLLYVSNLTWNDINQSSEKPSSQPDPEDELSSSTSNAPLSPMPPPGPPPEDFPLFPDPPAYKPATIAFPVPPSGPAPPSFPTPPTSDSQHFPDLMQFPDPPSGLPPPYPTEQTE